MYCVDGQEKNDSWAVPKGAGRSSAAPYHPVTEHSQRHGRVRVIRGSDQSSDEDGSQVHLNLGSKPETSVLNPGTSLKAGVALVTQTTTPKDFLLDGDHPDP